MASESFVASGGGMSFSPLLLLFVFLPLFFLSWSLASALRKGTAELVLFLFTLVFLSFFGLRWPCLLLCLLCFNYACGLVLGMPGDEQVSKWRGATLFVGVLANLAPLALLRPGCPFYGFLGEAASGFSLHLAAAPGLAFWSLTQIAWLSSIYRRTAEPEGFLRHAAFSCSFPCMLGGPLLRYEQMGFQFDSLPGTLSSKSFAEGLCRFFLGLAKKVCLADLLAMQADAVFEAAASSAPLSTSEAWLGLLSFSFQIYFDFSSCADMAIGLGRMMGIHYPENFNSPYRATSLIEFWRRWHVTFSTWLRDCVFLPLGGSRIGRGRQFVGFFATALVAGVWHGASLTFLIWGVLHAFFLFINFLLRECVRGRALESLCVSFLFRLVSCACTFLLVSLSWVVFRTQSVFDALVFYRTLAGSPFVPDGIVAGNVSGGFFAPPSIALLAVSALLVFVFPSAKEFLEGKKDGRRSLLAWNPSPAWAFLLGLLSAVAVFFLPWIRPFIF